MLGGNSWIVDASVKGGRQLSSPSAASGSSRAVLAEQEQSPPAGAAADGDDADDAHDEGVPQAEAPAGDRPDAERADPERPDAGRPNTERPDAEVAEEPAPAAHTPVEPAPAAVRARAPGWTPNIMMVLAPDEVEQAVQEVSAEGPRLYGTNRRGERIAMIFSTLLGTLGIIVAFAAAGLDQVKYDQPVPCAAYAAAHKKEVAFGCTASAKHVAVLLPAIGIPLLVLVALTVTWVPQRAPRARLACLGVYLLLLALAAVGVALAYSGLPPQAS